MMLSYGLAPRLGATATERQEEELVALGSLAGDVAIAALRAKASRVLDEEDKASVAQVRTLLQHAVEYYRFLKAPGSAAVPSSSKLAAPVLAAAILTRQTPDDVRHDPGEVLARVLALVDKFSNSPREAATEVAEVFGHLSRLALAEAASDGDIVRYVDAQGNE